MAGLPAAGSLGSHHDGGARLAGRSAVPQPFHGPEGADPVWIPHHRTRHQGGPLLERHAPLGGDGCGTSRTLLEIGDGQGIVGADWEGTRQAGIGHLHRHRQGGFLFEIQRRACFQDKPLIHHLKQVGIGAQQADGVAAKPVVADHNVCHLEVCGQGGVLRQGAGHPSEAYDAGGLVGGRGRRAVSDLERREDGSVIGRHIAHHQLIRGDINAAEARFHRRGGGGGEASADVGLVGEEAAAQGGAAGAHHQLHQSRTLVVDTILI